jgi:glycosyltransferase involved in cell wall biosynthesis
MACGTPVIAYPCGSVPEIITTGVTGFVVPDIDRAVEAVGKLGEIDRKECRKHFELNFSDERMAREYLGIYERLVRGKSPALTVEDGVLSWTDLASPSSTT